VQQTDRPAAGLRIGDVARSLGVSPSTVRAWERKGLVAPARGERGEHRRYGPEDVAKLRDVRALLSRGYSPPALREMLSGDAVPEVAMVGARLRQARTKRALSIRRAARIAGLSPSYLSLVERGLADASVAMLQRVASAYGGTLLEFLNAGAEAAEETNLVRAGERRRLQGFDRVEIEDLVRFPNAVLEIDIFTVAPGGGSGGNYSHDGEEAIFVLEGALNVWLDDVEHHHIVEGDTLYFKSAQSHRWSNPGDIPARLFWVNTPPTF
jgi:DNA-binding transcriptional MerR regulator/quercetin dioxygenase-like cupin family protein